MRLLLLLTLLVILHSGCVKQHCTDKGEELHADAKIIFTGGLEVDGCDWVVQVNPSTNLHPETIDPVFKQNNLDVRVSYVLTGAQFTCGWNAKIPVIKITHIEK